MRVAIVPPSFVEDGLAYIAASLCHRHRDSGTRAADLLCVIKVPTRLAASETGAGMGGSSGQEGAGVCAACGKPLVGPFCSQCGAAAPAGGEGWGVIASELFDSQQSKGHAATLLSFLKAPVETILRLTDDASYRQHWTFLSLALGVQFALGFLILPQLLGRFYVVPDLGGKEAVITNQIGQYLGIAILTPIQYYICRAVGSIARRPASYVKLCVLSVSFCSILSTIAILSFWIVGPATAAGGYLIDPWLLGNGLTSLLQIAIMVFVTKAHKRFWGMKLWVAILITLGMAILSWVVVYPTLVELITWSGMVATIDQMMP